MGNLSVSQKRLCPKDRGEIREGQEVASSQCPSSNVHVCQMADVVAIQSRHDAGPHFSELDEYMSINEADKAPKQQQDSPDYQHYVGLNRSPLSTRNLARDRIARRSISDLMIMTEPVQLNFPHQPPDLQSRILSCGWS